MLIEVLKKRTVLEWGLILFALILPISIAAETILFLCLAIWIAGSLRRMREWWSSIRRNPYLIPVLVFVVIASLTVFWSVRPGETLHRLHRLLIPLLVLLMGDLYGRPSSRTFGVREPIFAFVVGCVLLGLYDLFRIPRAGLDAGAFFSAGTMRDPQMYMAGLCLLLAIVGSDGRRDWIPMIWAASLLLGAGILLHFKRGVWFAMTAVLLLLSLITRTWRLPALLLVFAFCILAVPWTRAPVLQRIDDLSDLRRDEAGGRYALWTDVAPRLLPKYPFGMGWSAVKNEDFVEHAGFVQKKLNHMHNNLLQVTLETGLPGSIAWSIWMITAFVVMARRLDGRERSMRARLNVGVLCAFSGLMLNGAVEYNFGDTEILMLFSFLMGCSASE